MNARSNAAPVIIKRKKIVGGGGHHGGAWKVAYADFVTAMMAFFMLMWLLNATTENQRKGIADYFSPTVPVNRISGGGDGAFGGDSMFSEQVLAHNGLGAAARHPAREGDIRGQSGADQGGQAETAQLDRLAEILLGKGGESLELQSALRHVVTRVTDEGLIVEIFDLEDAPLFEADGATPRPVARQLAQMLAEVFALAKNDVAVNGHIRAYPVVLLESPVWDLSTARARMMRALMEGAGLEAGRSRRISGFADRVPAVADRAAVRNNRLEVILLRSGAGG